MCDQLYDKKFLKSNEADDLWQNQSFLDDIVMENRKLFIAFDYRKESVDLFLGQFLHGNEHYKFMRKVMVFVFTLPHGQSQIERGFNINKEIIIEDMIKESVKAQKIIYDTMKAKQMSPDSMTCAIAV